MCDAEHDFFPDAFQWVERIRVLEDERDAKRRARIACAHELSPRAFTIALDSVVERMKVNARLSPEERGGAFAVLSDEDIGIIERQLENDERIGRLKVIRRRTRSQRALALLRTNLHSGKTLVDGPMFRQIARGIYEDLRDDVLAFLGNGTTEWSAITLVVPWRAGLIGAEVFRQFGIRRFWHLGMRRNERTLEAETYFESGPPTTLGGSVVLICDPMLASGNTNAAIIRHCMKAGVPAERIVNFALIAAPEGIDRLLYEFDGIRVMTLALDGRLNTRGYITDPGLGDFGDLALNDVGAAYAEEHWLKTGLLTQPMVEIILGRTEEVKAGLVVHAHAPT